MRDLYCNYGSNTHCGNLIHLAKLVANYPRFMMFCGSVTKLVQAIPDIDALFKFSDLLKQQYKTTTYSIADFDVVFRVPHLKDGSSAACALSPLSPPVVVPKNLTKTAKIVGVWCVWLPVMPIIDLSSSARTIRVLPLTT